VPQVLHYGMARRPAERRRGRKPRPGGPRLKAPRPA
jgi:hypothetical protein